MKKLIWILFITLKVNATTIGQYISSPDGSSLQSFSITRYSLILDKKSNFFDREVDYSLGKFEARGNFSDEEKELKNSLTKIKQVDAFLKKKNSRFNELSSKKPHESFITLDQYRVSQESDLYRKLKTMIDSLLSRKWKHVSGIRLSENFKEVISIRDGKETSRTPFNMQFSCKDPAPPTVCGFKDLGIIFIK